MFKKALGLSLLLFAFPALAADLSYNFIQLGYQQLDLDEDLIPGVSIDGNGFGVSGSFEINDSWFIDVGYSKLDFDFDVELDQYAIGAGWHTGMSDNADFFATLSYVSAEASASGLGSVDEDGIGAKIGVRGMIGENFELGGSIAYVDLGDAGDGSTFGAHGVYNFSENFGAGFTVEIDEDVTAYGLGVRIYFGN